LAASVQALRCLCFERIAMSNKLHLIWMIPLAIILWAQIGLGLMEWDIDRKCAQYDSKGSVVFPVQYCERMHQGTSYLATWTWMESHAPKAGE
jgi:hypothetical protein